MPESPDSGFVDRILGRPLASHEEEDNKVGVKEGIPMLGLDALSSAAYGPEAALAMLIPAGVLGLSYIWPITLVLLGLLAILFLSYRQTIGAYPNGGGSYTVAKENLGTFPGLFAAASLMLDYILNVAVGISAGVEALVSAFPTLPIHFWRFSEDINLHDHMVAICLIILAFISLVNLRGIKESGVAFALPTYFFVSTLFITITVGLWRCYQTGGSPIPIEVPPVIPPGTETVGALLLIKAFANGCTAMTGVEAVSNGVPAFRKPGVQNAQRTLAAIIAILAVLLAGIAYLCVSYKIMAMNPDDPKAQSVLSMLVAAVMGRGWFYYVTLISILAVVALSANTSFADFPRLCRLIALDDYLPRSFTLRGRRLVFHVGILILAGLAAILLIGFGGITDRLIPLFAIGALGAFTLSQAGMVVHWIKSKERGYYKLAMFINGLGAVATAFALTVVLIAKFTEGAWITVLLIPCLVFFFYATHQHYQAVAQRIMCAGPLDLSGVQAPIVVVPVRGWTSLAERGLRMALSLSNEVIAVSIITGEDSQEVEKLQSQWEANVAVPARAAGRAVPELRVMESPYRDVVAPLLKLLEETKEIFPTRTITVIVPELVEQRWYHWLLHNQRATVLKTALLFHGDSRVVVLNVPWYFEQRKRT